MKTNFEGISFLFSIWGHSSSVLMEFKVQSREENRGRFIS